MKRDDNMSYYNSWQSLSNYTYVRLLNAIPGSPGIDVYMNGESVAENLEYAQFTNYLIKGSDTYTLEAYKHNTYDEPIISIRLYLFANTYYTIPLIGTMELPEIELIADRPSAEETRADLSYIRFVNLSPNSNMSNIDIDGVPIIYHLHYMEVSNYLPLTKCNFSLSVIVDNKTYTYPDIKLNFKKYYTIYILGYSKGLEPGITVEVSEEGRGNIVFSSY